MITLGQRQQQLPSCSQHQRSQGWELGALIAAPPRQRGPPATAGWLGSVSALESIDPMAGRGFGRGGTNITQGALQSGAGGDLRGLWGRSVRPHTSKEEESGSDGARGGLHRAPTISFEVALPQWLLQGKDRPQQFTATHLPPPTACNPGVCRCLSPWFLCLDLPWSFKAWIRSKERFGAI